MADPADIQEREQRRELRRLEPAPHIGLGKASTIDALEIRWPGSGPVQHFGGPIAADRVYEIREGENKLKPVLIVTKTASQATKERGTAGHPALP